MKLAIRSVGSLLAVLAVMLLVSVALPFNTLKLSLDHLTLDGDFGLLKPENWGVFRASFLILGLLLAAQSIWLLLWPDHFIHTIRSFRPRVDWKQIVDTLRADTPHGLYLVIFLFIFALALYLRLEHLNKPLFHDEAYTVTAFASHSFLKAISDYSLPNNHILNTILVFITIRIFGFTPWAVHIPPLITGLILVLSIYFLGCRIYNQKTALLAMLLTALSPAVIEQTNSARGYILVMLFSVITAWLADLVSREKNNLAWVLLPVCTALGFYAVPVFMFPFGMVFAWLFFEGMATGAKAYQSRWEFLRYYVISGFGAALLTLALYLPVFLITGVKAVFENNFVLPLRFSTLSWRLPFLAGRTWNYWTSGVSDILVPILVVGFIIGLLLHWRVSRQKVPILFAAIVWIGIVILVRRPDPWIRLWHFLLPFCLFVASAGIMGLLRILDERVRWRVSFASTVLVGSLVLAMGNGLTTLPDFSQIWTITSTAERATLFMKPLLHENDLVIAGRPHRSELEYYFRQYGISGSYWKKTDATDRVWVLVFPPKGQTLERFLKMNKLDPVKYNSKTMKILDDFDGGLIIYLGPQE